MDRRTILGFAIGPLGAAALSFISLPIMTWIFPPATIGKLSILQVTIQLSTLLFCLGLDQAYVREYHESAHKPTLLLNTTLPGLLLMLMALLALSLVAPTALARLLYGDTNTIASVVTAGCLMMAYLSRFLSLILRMQNRGLAFSMSQLLSKLLLLSIVLSYALLPVTRTFMLLLVAQAAALLLTLVVFLWNTRRDWLPALHARFDRPMFNRLFAFGWPLVFGSVASWGLVALDRIFLRSMAGYDQLAIYSVSASIASGVTIVSGIFNTIWAPLVFKWVADKIDTRRVDFIAEQVSSLVLMLICLAGGCSWVLRYLLPPSYNETVYLIVGCMIAPMLYTLSEVTGVGITVSRRTTFALAASTSAVALNSGLCYVLVPKLGATGAMIATASAFWLFFVLRTEFSTLVWCNMRRRKIHIYALLAVIAAVCYGLVGPKWPVGTVIAWWVAFVWVIFTSRLMLISLVSSWRKGINSI